MNSTSCGRRGFIVRLGMIVSPILVGLGVPLSSITSVLAGARSRSWTDGSMESLRESLGIVGQACSQVPSSGLRGAAGECLSGLRNPPSPQMHPEDVVSWWVEHRDEVLFRIEDDFERERTRTINGWILSETEAATYSVFRNLG